jgi:hypothetical protein
VKPQRHVALALVLGLALGGFVACGGSRSSLKSGAAPATSMPGGADAPEADPRGQITQLDAQITADLEKLAMPRPTEPPSISAEAMSAGGAPACQVPASPTCADSCKLADSICDNAGRICKLAGQLENDPWANEKCSSGTASCEAARKRCCDCT